MIKGNLYRVVVSGPESTGKTELSKSLAERLHGVWIPEYARQYIENLNRPYNYQDVEQIARFQIKQELEVVTEVEHGFLIFDTWLIITKVWFDLVFGRCPDWVIDHIKSSKIDLFLVCNTDLPWIFDPVRENGGERREQLLKLYCEEISTFGFKYEIVSGFDDARTENACLALLKNGLQL